MDVVKAALVQWRIPSGSAEGSSHQGIHVPKESSVPRKLSTHLKIHVEEPARGDDPSPDRNAKFDLQALMQAFTQATGWLPCPSSPAGPLNATELLPEAPRPDAGLLPLRSRVKLVSADPIDGMLDPQDLQVSSEEEAWKLLEQIDQLVQQLIVAEAAVAIQETQLATAVGVSIRKDEAELLTARLHESLQRAAEQTGSDAAAIYLLDD